MDKPEPKKKPVKAGQHYFEKYGSPDSTKEATVSHAIKKVVGVAAQGFRSLGKATQDIPKNVARLKHNKFMKKVYESGDGVLISNAVIREAAGKGTSKTLRDYRRHKTLITGAKLQLARGAAIPTLAIGAGAKVLRKEKKEPAK